MSDTDVQDPQEPVELQIDTAHSDDSPDPTDAGLTADQTATLFSVLRIAYPHPSFPDGPYQRTARAVADADADAVLAGGLAGLDAAADGDFRALAASDPEAATAAIAAIQESPFFKLIHSTTVVALYDDHEVWDILGYEGASYDKGGYLHRGFDDLDWLPDPRIEEYTGEPRVELVTASAGDSASRSANNSEGEQH